MRESHIGDYRPAKWGEGGRGGGGVLWGGGVGVKPGHQVVPVLCQITCALCAMIRGFNGAG